MAFTICGKRAVLYAPVTPLNGHYSPSFVIEDEPFLFPTDWNWGIRLARVERCVRMYNEKLGYTQEHADAIVASSIAASNRARKHATA